MADTPNYLGFYMAAPKTSPMMSAMQGALGTYGEVQDLIQKTDVTRALPEYLATQQQTANLQVQKLATEQKYYPTQLEQDQKKRQLFLDALPKMLQNQISGEQLDNIIKGYTSKSMQLSDQQNTDVYLANKLGILYDMSNRDGISNDKIENQYQNIREQAIRLGENPNDIPATFDDNAKALGRSALINSPGSVEKLKFQEEIAKQALINKGKLDVAHVKDDSGYNAYTMAEGKADSGYASDVIDGGGAASSVIPLLDSMENMAKQNPADIGFVAGKYSGKITEKGSAMMSTGNQLVLNLAEQLKGKIGATALRNSLTMNMLKLSKPDVNMPYQAYLDTIQRLRADSTMAIEKANFLNYCQHNGVNNRGEIEKAWSTFMNRSSTVDKEGKFHPEEAKGWNQFFTDNPNMLPEKIQTRIQNDAYQAALRNNIISNQGIMTPYSGQSTQDNYSVLNAMAGGQ